MDADLIGYFHSCLVRAFVIVLLLGLGIGVVLMLTFEKEPTKPEKPKREWQTRTCEMCGQEWNVLPNKPGEIVPPTIEWCFHDGNFCSEGFGMVQRSLKGEDVDREFLNHCLECTGCRCAMFQPKEWHDFMETLNKIRLESEGE